MIAQRTGNPATPLASSWASPSWHPAWTSPRTSPSAPRPIPCATQPERAAAYFTTGGIGMPAAIELVEDKGSRKPALGLGAKVVAEAGKRGLIMRQRGGADGPPASGDPLCLAPRR